jgi:hypothetical protein
LGLEFRAAGDSSLDMPSERKSADAGMALIAAGVDSSSSDSAGGAMQAANTTAADKNHVLARMVRIFFVMDDEPNLER